MTHENEVAYNWSCGAFSGLIRSCSFWDQEANDADYDDRTNKWEFVSLDYVSSKLRMTSGDVRTPAENSENNEK